MLQLVFDPGFSVKYLVFDGVFLLFGKLPWSIVLSPQSEWGIAPVESQSTYQLRLASGLEAPCRGEHARMPGSHLFSLG